MRLLLLASAGGAIGAGLRYAMAAWAASLHWNGFPWATFIVNVTGSALMGLVAGLALSRPELTPELRVFLATGILGGYTTFSAFSLEVWQLAERGHGGVAALYVLASVALSVASLGLGLFAAKAFTP